MGWQAYRRAIAKGSAINRGRDRQAGQEPPVATKLRGMDRMWIVVPVAALLVALPRAAWSQEAEHESVGRGWPVPVMQPSATSAAAWKARVSRPRGTDRPTGVTPLPVDLFTSKDFYQDESCGRIRAISAATAPSTLQAMWGADALSSRRLIGTVASAERLVGPLRDRLSARGDRLALSVQDRAGALRGAARGDQDARRSDGLHARESAARLERTLQPRDLAEVHGRARGQDVRTHPSIWPSRRSGSSRRSTRPRRILSLLTPEYRRRTVQMHYHQSVNNAPLWPAQFCWPDGFMRLFSRQAHLSMDFVDDAGAGAAHGEQRGELHPPFQRRTQVRH